MRALFGLLVMAGMVSGHCLSHFYKFARTYHKDYSHDEIMPRYRTFCKNLQYIKNHNESNWSVAINEFADLSFEEFKQRHYGIGYRLPSKEKFIIDDSLEVDIPTSADWRTKGAVTPVKNQGMCGSCWAFSTTGSVEGAWVLQGGHSLTSLSEQQLVDCAQAEGNNGCNGGLMDYGFQYIIDNGGICTEASYAYTGSDGTCKKTCSKVATITGFKDIPQGNEQALLNAVGTVGPVSVAIEADQQGFQFYSRGVFDASCGTNLDHGVLVVGYGTDTGKDYWIVKNSWGSSWGESGYIRMIRGKNQCGITLSASYPLV
jgi:C1A family cysteine protease